MLTNVGQQSQSLVCKLHAKSRTPCPAPNPSFQHQNSDTKFKLTPNDNRKILSVKVRYTAIHKKQNGDVEKQISMKKKKSEII